MYLLVRRNKACATAGSGAKAILFFSAFIFPLILWRADTSDLVLSLIFFHSPRVNTRRGTWNVAPQLSDSFVGEKKNKKTTWMRFPQPSTLAASPEAVCGVESESRCRVMRLYWCCATCCFPLWRCLRSGAVRFLTARVKSLFRVCLSETWLETLLFFSPA